MMMDLNTILAKSISHGGLTLLEHTQQVAETIAVFAQKYAFDFDVELARKGAILHDLGKAHPAFQKKVNGYNYASLAEKGKWDFAHRHELSSLAFLPVFPEEEWDTLIDLVVAHHKSIENDPSERGILDLDQNDREWIENHLYDWENWKDYALEILRRFDIPTREVSITEAEQALNYVVTYCEGKKNGWSPLRGLLKSADHFASAFMRKTQAQLTSLFEVPDLSYYRAPNRQHDLYPLSKICTDDRRRHTLVVAPTGAGKTDFLLKRCTGRIFYTLPFQASINAMFTRIKENVPNKDIRLLHATSKIVAKNKLDEQVLQPLSGSAIKVLTPHQLAAMVFGTSGFESVMLDVQGTDVILDEIHTYSDFSRSMVIEIVKTLLRLNCRVHIGTATMPSVLYNELLEILGGITQVYEVKLEDKVLDSFNRHQVYKIEKVEEVVDILKKAFLENEKVLLVYNTIKKAQEAYIQLQKAFPNIPKMLIHSRFRRGDRVELEKTLTEDFNTKKEACLVIATQVVEVSLDISFDRMITQCAPLDGLIQRFGRVNRIRNEQTVGKYKPVHVIQPSGNVLPYKMEVLQASFEQLPEEGDVLQERSIQEKIDAVYPELDMKEIDIHLIYKEGKYRIKELQNHKKGVLVEALEIESATCILESDRDAYLSSSWEERIPLEIPINYKSLSRHKNKYEQLEVGAYPFVVPQELEEYKEFGLQLVDHDNFL
ncbi:CRISPR-associated helicase Cas3' [Rapidithrix thailandica]|uniref:CRISPR-associated helicase Cas3 n=1 Tax=Rapidithrix thailandica TaxID=413964 RepID=A0AAW9S6K6_9BACT